MKKNKAFTLLELLVAMLLAGLVMGAVLAIMFSVFKSYELHLDITEAKQRGHIALASMQPFVLNAGVGLPKSAADFQKAFQRVRAIMPADNPAGQFRGFVQLAVNGESRVSANQREAPAVWVVSAVASGAGVNTSYLLFQNVQPVRLERFAEAAVASNVTTGLANLKAWVCFPSAEWPFGIPADPPGGIDAVSGTLALRCEADSPQAVAAYDEMHYVRAAKLFVSAGSVSERKLLIDRLDGSDAQSVDGIVALWCEFDAEGDRVLTLHVLARSNTRRSDQMQSEMEGWPPGAVDQKEALDPRYRYAAVSRSWRIRN